MRFGLRWPKSADVMEQWLKLPARVMSAEEKKGEIPARHYPKQYVNTSLIQWDWLSRFPLVEQAVQQLISRVNTPNAQRQLRERFKSYLSKTLSKSQTFPITIHFGLHPVELHSDWQFQFAEAGYQSGVMDDLYGSLGNFAVYAAVTKATIFKPGDKQYFATVSEIGLYVRDTFDFNGPQYLGHWSKEGMGIVLAGGVGNKLEREWKLPGWSPELGIVQPLNNSDFRAFRNNFGVGGDLLLFSDVRTHATQLQTEVSL